MKKLFRYVCEYFREDLRYGHLFFSIAFVTVCLLLNYTFQIRPTFTRIWKGTFTIYVFHFFFYGLSLFAGFGSYMIAYKRWDLLRKKGFLSIVFSIWATLVLISSVRFEDLDLFGFLPEELRYLSLLCLNYGINTAIYLILPVGYYFLKKPETSLGLETKTELLPYWILLLLMIPIVFWASGSPSFLKVYPRYSDTTASEFLGISPYWTFGIFELFYLTNFVALEMFFRGFMIYPLVKYLGKNSILPMAIAYCFLHFNKPFGEALGSFFGGWILGIFSYRSGSIVGGIIVHLGVAATMEILAHFARGTF
ncbi:CPBP family intramembrane glutamic endopeptidase [Leptospira adleri]|uniref:CAAX prenyl protease 2/Lysostaphin resistance protein A-like domain-containing protein n=1 Tax=Leptospira adleri TaxID=2023186 RepID=A0A2M9YNK8_9LEPT|nr:CPBP family intramembrane glutamic endopeptidase [Leptospira adleri]PJZ53124.1 hypothetical protein CH380_11975 [Leptospira adleri]PJZ62086.1 hypothetical protein CH376_09870 [Leptospira adleri]